MKVAVIPARGGSKRILRKNIKNFYGKPIIAWSIEAAINSKCFDKVIVSTDDKEIAEVALSYGAEVPFIRPAYLSDDYTNTTKVVKHAIEWYEENGTKINLACCIYATAPFISIDDILEGLVTIEENECQYVFSVTNYEFPIQRSFRIANNGVEMLYPENFSKRSQDLEEIYHDAGQFYWGKPSSWIDDMDIFCEHSLPIFIPRYRVIDIDNENDWQQAEIMFEILKTHSG